MLLFLLFHGKGRNLCKLVYYNLMKALYMPISERYVLSYVEELKESVKKPSMLCCENL